MGITTGAGHSCYLLSCYPPDIVTSQQLSDSLAWGASPKDNEDKEKNSTRKQGIKTI